MFNQLQNEFDVNVRKIASNNLIKKLNSQGIQINDISKEKFGELLQMEIEILKTGYRYQNKS